MDTNVRGVTTLGNSAIGVLRTIGINLVGAVVFLIGLAVVASQIGADLGPRTDTVADFMPSDLGSDLNDAANNLVSYAKRKRNLLTPSTGDGVDI